HENCSLHARRLRNGARDASVGLLERALAAAGPQHPRRRELLAALAQATAFGGLAERALRAVEEAIEVARDFDDPGMLARTLLSGVATHDPVAGWRRREELAREAAALAQIAQADELLLDAL